MFTKVEEMWAGFLPSEDATTMSKDEAADLLKNVAERTDINEEVFTEIFTDQETGEPLSEVAKEQMHSICQVYMLFLEKQRAREVFEAKKEMVEFQRANNDLAPHRGNPELTASNDDPTGPMPAKKPGALKK